VGKTRQGNNFLWQKYPLFESVLSFGQNKQDLKDLFLHDHLANSASGHITFCQLYPLFPSKRIDTAGLEHSPIKD
jgi:hypothetical protein